VQADPAAGLRLDLLTAPVADGVIRGRAGRVLPGVTTSRPYVAAMALTAFLAVVGCAAPSPASARLPRRRPPAPPAAAPCKLKTTFNYIVRTTEPGMLAQAQEIGNVDLGNCTAALQDFTATAGQAQGECTTIALSSDNPSYNVNASPARRLRKVIMRAGPGC
jgi:hypothetical protein